MPGGQTGTFRFFFMDLASRRMLLWSPMGELLDRVLAAARQLGASDVHLKVGLPPIFRIKGELRTVRDVGPLTTELLREFAASMMNEKQREDYNKYFECDLAYSTPDGVRYRVNV